VGVEGLLLLRMCCTTLLMLLPCWKIRLFNIRKKQQCQPAHTLTSGIALSLQAGQVCSTAASSTRTSVRSVLLVQG
jgi:hypothetical protein